jgi:hypothetical protein
LTKTEFTKFYAYITAAVNDTNPSKARVEVYWDALNDLPFEVAMIAAKKVIATLENPFLPMPAVFRKVAAELTQPKILTAGEAYEHVLQAIHKFGSYREQDALNYLDDLTQKAVKAVGWKSLCLSEQPDTVRAQFRKAYEAMQSRAETEAKVPQKLKELISMTTDKMIPESKANARPQLTAAQAEKYYL